MIDKLKHILQEAINDLEASRATSLPPDDMTVRQALERLRADHDDMVCLQIEWTSYGSGQPFTVSFKAYDGVHGWTGEMPSLSAVLASVTGGQQDAASTADELLASVTDLQAMPY